MDFRELFSSSLRTSHSTTSSLFSSRNFKMLSMSTHPIHIAFLMEIFHTFMNSEVFYGSRTHSWRLSSPVTLFIISFSEAPSSSFLREGERLTAVVLTWFVKVFLIPIRQVEAFRRAENSRNWTFAFLLFTFPFQAHVGDQGQVKEEFSNISSMQISFPQSWKWKFVGNLFIFRSPLANATFT